MPDLTVDSFRALARSSPWRWRRLHLSRHGWFVGGHVEAWVDRPGRLRVRDADGRMHRVEETTNGGVFLRAVGPDHTGPPPAEPRTLRPDEVEPVLRPDGLVAERPEWVGRDHVAYGDPMWQNYEWVAMLDPVELSHDVELSDLVVGELHGRPVWRATAVPREGYEPRCGCCPLLRGEPGDRLEWGDRFVGRLYPTAYRVGLDVETAVVVSLAPVGETDLEGLEPWEVRIHEVDGPDPFPVG